LIVARFLQKRIGETVSQWIIIKRKIGIRNRWLILQSRITTSYQIRMKKKDLMRGILLQWWEIESVNKCMEYQTLHI
jgi:hypothetical protein